MSLKRFLDTLQDFGLKPSDAKIYVHLAKKGPQKARDICNEMNLTKQQVYQCLENLQKKGMVHATEQHPAFFHALPFEKVLDMLINQKIGEAEETQKQKTELLTKWQSMNTKDAT